MKLTLPRAALRAAALFAAPSSDRRPYIKGVALEIASDEVRIVATNGHAMAVYREVECAEGVASTEEFTIIVPSEALKALSWIPAKRERVDRKSVVITNNENGSYAMLDGTGYSRGEETGFFPVEGSFPHYRRITPDPRNISGDTAQFDPTLMMLFVKAAKEFELRSTAVKLWHNGNAAGIVALDGEPNFYGLIMPLLGAPGLNAEVPSWAKETHKDRLLKRFVILNEPDTRPGTVDRSLFRAD